MKLQVHSIHFDADKTLVFFIQKRLDKLETFYDRPMECEVFLKLANQRVDNKIIEVKLHVPKGQFFAKEQNASFEEATELVVEALRRQIRKFKEKQHRKRD